MSAVRHQRYAMLLADYPYGIQYRSTRLHGNYDGPSRISLQTNPADKTDTAEIVHVSKVETLPMSNKHVRRETVRDPGIIRVYSYVLSGWPDKQEHSAIYNRQK